MDPVTMRAYAESFKPMLANPSKDTLKALAGSHLFDTKLDGIRAVAFWDGRQLALRNRNGRDITHRFPELDVKAQSFDGPVVLDGEIVAISGSFQDVAKRDKQNKPEDVARVMRQIPVEFVAFDLPYIGDQDLRGQTYLARRQGLEVFENDSMRGGFTVSVASQDPAFYDAVKQLGGEGVIAKRLRSTYRAGRSSDWQKFKTVTTVTCVAVGYERGNGARAEFGAVHLAMIDGSQVVPVGKVGTGMKQHDIDSLKKQLDSGTPVVVEIECLNVTKEGALRFPVFKGERTDLKPIDAQLSQLASIPRT